MQDPILKYLNGTAPKKRKTKQRPVGFDIYKMMGFKPTKRDRDGDGVSNRRDCQPNNPFAQDRGWWGESDRHSQVQGGKGKRKRKPVTFKEEMAGMGKGKWVVNHIDSENVGTYTQYVRKNSETRKTETILLSHNRDGTCNVEYDTHYSNPKAQDATKVEPLAKNVSFTEAKRIAERKIMTSNMISGL